MSFVPDYKARDRRPWIVQHIANLLASLLMVSATIEDAGARKVLLLLDKATNSTAQEVDPRLLKAIKSTVRSSDIQVHVAVGALMAKLGKDHSQVRYLTILIVDELFMRSKLFRSLLVTQFDQFLSLSIGFRRNLPLPPPALIASRLRTRAIEFLEKWNSSFGIYYKQLRIGYDYLKNTLKFQFPNRLENAASGQRENRTKEILLKKYESLKDDFPSIKNNIESDLREIRECFQLVSVKEEKNERVDSLDDNPVEEYRSTWFQQIRLQSLKEGEKIHESTENKSVFDVLREFYRLLVAKHLPSVQEWIHVLVRVDASDTGVRDSLLKEFIDIRNDILSVMKGCQQLDCTVNISSTQEAEEDIWEEGKIEVYDHENLSGLMKPAESSAGTRKTPDKVLAEESKIVPHEIDGADSTSLRARLLAAAPIVDWGSYLDNWGSTTDVLANQRGLEIENHWGRVDYDAVVPAEKVAELNLHATVYKEQVEEIRPCLAPLPNGRLCQRRDLRICPFHGPILPHDLDGNPVLKEFLHDERAPVNPAAQKGKDPLNLEKMAVRLAKQSVKNVRDSERKEGKVREDIRKAIKRARIVMVHEHNESVLRQSAMASTSWSESIGDHVETGSSTKKQTLASMLRKKMTTRGRLTQKLLNCHGS